jgi:uncharacterized delta-60 repeat protein
MSRLFRTWPIAALCVMQVLTASPADAASGDLDPSFGSGGIRFTDVTGGIDGAFAQAIQPDGRIVTVGGASLEAIDARFVVARWEANGFEDDSFGYEGQVTRNLTRRWDAAWGVAVQSDGKIVVAGDAGFGAGNSKFGIVRFNPDGTRDRDYGSVITDFTRNDDSVAAAAIEPDDDLVVVGAINASGRDPRIAVARYRADGTLDPGFGAGGLARANPSRHMDWANAVAIQPDGRIVVAGLASRRTVRIAVLRFLPDGSPDPSFGGDGVTLTRVGDGASAQAVAVLPDGRILVAGGYSRGRRTGFAVMRYLEDGRLDPTFGGDGIVTTTFPDADAHGWGLAVQPDGKAVVVGTVLRDGRRNRVTGLVRYRTDGTRDTSFGDLGRVLLNFHQGDQYLRGIGIDATGNIVISGQANSYLVVARVLA